MPTRNILGTDITYDLVVFDEEGEERYEPDGSLLSTTVVNRVAESASPVTDVFIVSHSWKGDIPAAIDQYDRWVSAMAVNPHDVVAAHTSYPDFRSLIVCLHWPSLPWGDESIPSSGGALLSTEAELDAQVEAYARRIADTPSARAAIRLILEAARRTPGGTALPPAVDAAYAQLFEESGLESGDSSGRPGADQDGFDPAAIMAAAQASGTPALLDLGLGDSLRDVLLMPLRQLSFWKMKDHARQFGETGGHDLLVRLQKASPQARIHLMGHSFGCIVVSATVAGAPDAPALPRPVDSLFLAQGALSLWAYAGDIPYSPGTAGYFYPIRYRGLVRGPIVTTRSEHDTAVGRLYPLGAQLKRQLVLGEEYPLYGGIGSFGIRGLVGLKDLTMGSAEAIYDFRPGQIYNLEASTVICDSEGLSGAHSDIVHPEVVHAFWQAVLAGQPRPALGLPDIHGLERDRVVMLGSESGMRGGGLLGATPESPAVSATPATRAHPAQRSETSDTRWVNAEIEDKAPGESLVQGHWYTLAFDVDLLNRGIASSRLVNDDLLFPEGIEEVVLTIQLDSQDFEITEHARPLRLPRVGRSLGKARFDLSPQHDGPSTLKATVHKDGNFIQQIELTFDVGARRDTAVQQSARGRPPSAAGVLQARDISMQIEPAAGGYYDCVVVGAVLARARLRLEPAELADAVEAARRELMKVVMKQDAHGDYVFQTSIDIPSSSQEDALKIMARAGARLFQKLFFGPAAADDSKAVGEFLRKMATDPTKRLKLQIVAERTPVPWGLLYMGDASAGAILDWDQFLGMRHVIERIPLQNTLVVSDCAIPSDPALSVGINLNSQIDQQFQVDFVAQQQAFWTHAANSSGRLRVTTRTLGTEVLAALRGGEANDQILYFYCHADSVGIGAPGGPDASHLVLTDGSLSLGDLYLDAPPSLSMQGNPLVFINACESAEMSPSFYDGFVPYFMAKGARGVVGTECKTPALFAAVWAERFFERLLRGEPVGDVFLNLRREFLDQHGNPLGLLYSVYCDGDTVIQPAVS